MWEFDPSENEPLHPDLEATLTANPDDLDTHLVYADWLQSQGSPRGELIRLDHAIETAEDAEDVDRLEQARWELMQRHAELAPPRLSEMVLREIPEGQPSRSYPGDWELCQLVWRWGFANRVQIAGRGAPHSATTLIEEILTHPSGRFLQELAIGEIGPTTGFPLAVDALSLFGSRSVRKLHVANARPMDLARLPLENVSGLFAAFPKLRSLTLQGSRMQLGEVAHPEIRELRLISCALTRNNIASVTAAKLPKLDTLSLYIGNSDYGCDVLLDDLEPILSGSVFPGLRHLGLMNTELSDQIVAALVRAPVLETLETLDLSLGTLSGDGAQLLLQHAERFEHLAAVNLEKNSIPREMETVLARLPGLHFGEQKSPHNRYVTIWE